MASSPGHDIIPDMDDSDDYERELNGGPVPPPDLHIPDSAATVQVRVIDTNTLVRINPKLFWQPPIDGFTGLDAPIYCFLISHGNDHVIFDLGVRPDWENYAPKIVDLIRATTVVTVGTDVISVLESAAARDVGVSPADISAVIWSHNHFDHVGDASKFPASTDLVVGPGVREISWPGWPSNPNGGVLDSDAAGRVVREIAFKGERHVMIGRFDAYDFFGDGSFYLLDAPGHAVGHLCGLARTTPSTIDDEGSFVFMGADACHHVGVLRPSPYLPLVTCPGDLIEQHLHGHNNCHTEPFFTVAKGPLFPDRDAAMDTVRKIQELDASPHMFILMAHDLSLRDRIPMFPDCITDWRSTGLKRDTRWLFCQDFVSGGDGKRTMNAE